jgi:salicylate hydroxylase
MGSPIELRFHDGSTAMCDILIRADGIKLVVRKTMFQDAALEAQSQHRNADAAELCNMGELRFSSFFAYRMLRLIPTVRLSSISPQHRVFSSAMQVSVSVCAGQQLRVFTSYST